MLELGTTEHGPATDAARNRVGAACRGCRRDPTRSALDELREYVKSVLGEVDAAVSDWAAMRAQALELVDELASAARRRCPATAVSRPQQFLRLAGATTTSPSSASASTSSSAAIGQVGLQGGAGLGPGDPARRPRRRAYKPAAAARRRRSRSAPAPLVLTKANARATVHRPSLPRLRRRQAVRSRRTGDRRAPVPGPVRHGGLPRESPGHPAAGREGEAGPTAREASRPTAMTPRR